MAAKTKGKMTAAKMKRQDDAQMMTAAVANDEPKDDDDGEKARTNRQKGKTTH
jgi:hypothetical protein